MLLNVLVWDLISVYETASFELFYFASSLLILGALAALANLIAIIRVPLTILDVMVQKRLYRL